MSVSFHTGMAKPKEKAMTVRLQTEQAESLEMIAVVEGKHVSDIIRVALAEYQLKRTMDSDFQIQLQEYISRLRNAQAECTTL